VDNFSGDVTECLSRIRAGDSGAKGRLLELVTAQLRRIAERVMRSERSDHTLQPTALVNELYLQLLTRDRLDVRDRAHFFALAVQGMRRILVDHARSRRSKKRGGEQVRVDIEDIPLATSENIQRIVELDEALTRLEKLDARQCRVVELRFFAGLEETEVARLLGISNRTVKRDWAMAKAWLYGELQPFKNREERPPPDQ
jgi:RNA polymerase sigma-70 factor, ECF subfamily